MRARLSDAQVRDILIAEFALRRTAAAAAPPAGLLANSRDIGEILTTNTVALLTRLPDLGSGIGAIVTRLPDAGGVGVALLALALSVGAGGVVRHLWQRRAAADQSGVAGRKLDKGSYGSVPTILYGGLFPLLDLSGAVVFACTAMAVLYLVFHHPDLRLFVSGYLAVVTVVLMVRSVAEFMFPRDWPMYCLVALSGEATRRVHRLNATAVRQGSTNAMRPATLCHAGPSAVAQPGRRRTEKTLPWTGLFPILNSARDGFAGTAPVGCFEPGRTGAHDMIGKVWEWTDTAFGPSVARFTIKGGSFLCSEDDCRRSRVAARESFESRVDRPTCCPPSSASTIACRSKRTGFASARRASTGCP